MIQIEREKLDKVLEALERSVATCFNQYAHRQVMSQPDHFINTAITAIKEALTQTQEPVMWSDYESNGIHHKPVAWMDADGNVSDNNDHKCFPIPLYTTTGAK